MSYYIGVDGGGTSTRAVVINDDLEILGRGGSGSSNFYSVGLDKAMENIQSATDAALIAAKVGHGQIASWGLGLAGATSPHERNLLNDALAPLCGEAKVVVDEDAAAALAGAFGPQLQQSGGAILIAGTGANCFGQSASGHRAGADGLGPLLGDRGSGYWLGESALRAACASLENAGEKSALGQAILDHFKVGTVTELIPIVYGPSWSRDQMGALVPLTLRLSEEGDAVAQNLVETAGKLLSQTAQAVLGALDLHQLALVGGLIENSPRARAALSANLPGVELLSPRFEPVVGAALLAF